MWLSRGALTLKHRQAWLHVSACWWDVFLTAGAHAGVSCPDGCMLQSVWWTAHLCMPKACTDPSCGAYAENKIPFADEGHGMKGFRPAKDICEFGLNPPKGESPQMFINCADIVITGGGGAGTTPQPESIDAPEPVAEPAAEPVDAPEPEAEPVDAPEPVAERVDAPEPIDAPAAPVMVEAPEVMATPTLITSLLVIDMSDNSMKPLGDTIALSEYPNGFNIRAESPDPDDIRDVRFETSTGISETEYNFYYDMFNRGSWPDPSPGTLPTANGLPFAVGAIEQHSHECLHRTCQLYCPVDALSGLQ